MDENLTAEVALDLRDLGHDAQTVHDEGLVGVDDASLLDRVKLEGRVLVTLDKGIADVRAYPPGDDAGIVLLRPPSGGRLAVRAFAAARLPSVLVGDLRGMLAFVSQASTRIRQ